MKDSCDKIVFLRILIMLFSDEHGITEKKSTIQIDSMDDDLRNSLWNVINGNILFNTNTFGEYLFDYPLYSELWKGFFKKPMDDLDGSDEAINGFIKSWFFIAEWYEVYNFIQFVVNINGGENISNGITSSFNEILEREVSGFRFVRNKLVNITNEHEINEIQTAASGCSNNRLNTVKSHIDSAVSKYADRENPDYRNSIKESISAVESLVKIITSDTKGTLGKALKKLDSKIGVNTALINGFSSIYGYTSNADGIRHALTEDSNVSAEDARFMLVSCSAFINYLIEKSTKAGIDF